MRHLIRWALLLVLGTVGCIPSISTRLNEDLSGSNTVIVGVPLKDDCASILDNFKVGESLNKLRSDIKGITIDTYHDGGVTGFSIVIPFKTPEDIGPQIHLVLQRSGQNGVRPPTIDIPQTQEDPFKKIWTFTVKINPSQLLPHNDNCPIDRMTYKLSMPAHIESFSPTANQSKVSVKQPNDTTVEWTVPNVAQEFTLQARSVLVKLPPTPTPPNPPASSPTTPSQNPADPGDIIKLITAVIVLIGAVLGLLKLIADRRS